jgi:hypothetical protein
MAVTKAAYYGGDDQTPAIPSPGGDYPGPTPHAAKVGQHVFEAPSSGSGTGLASDGFAATDNVKVTRPANDVSHPAGQTEANAAFNAPAHPMQEGQLLRPPQGEPGRGLFPPTAP